MDTSPVRERADELRRQRAPYVHARVVVAERPTSAKPGDEAIVLADGTIEGFVGGTCAETTVRAQSLALLDAGESLVLRISPVEEAPQSGKLTVVNPCLSGGTLEIFLQPVIPAPLVGVLGQSPIAVALAGLGERLGYAIEPWAADRVDELAALVVASHGRDEEVALETALRAGVAYVGLVASRKRGEAVVAGLAVDSSLKARIRTPAGLDLGARTPEEIALSILAEIVASRPRPSARTGPPPGEPVTFASASGTQKSTEARDPVCGMAVPTVEASLHLDHDGARYWFCGTGCLRAFAADPDVYAAR
jgi:xanthine dehydrogenase accessory factor